jgi:hypothetical protein
MLAMALRRSESSSTGCLIRENLMRVRANTPYSGPERLEALGQSGGNGVGRRRLESAVGVGGTTLPVEVLSVAVNLNRKEGGFRLKVKTHASEDFTMEKIVSGSLEAPEMIVTSSPGLVLVALWVREISSICRKVRNGQKLRETVI